MKQKYRIFLIFPILLVPFLLAFTAADSITAALPPRPTVEPTKTKQPGAYIQLQLSGAVVGTEGVWTIVQWGDEFGVWNDVPGWQGTVELDSTQTWWVAPDDMGSGPFRWVVLTAEDGPVLTTSEVFDLPDQRKMVQIVSVVIE